VLFVVSPFAITYFHSEKIEDQVSQKSTPKNECYSVVRITEAVVTIDADMMHGIWDEIVYRWDSCRVTRGNHIEHLWIKLKHILNFVIYIIIL